MSGKSSKSSESYCSDARFYAAIYQKEFLSRLAWFEKNYKKVYESKPAESVPKKAKILYDELVRRRVQDHKHAPRFLVRRYLPPVPKPDPGIEILPPMRPVPQAHSDLLKEGSSAYLKGRYGTSPEDRYYFPVTSSWDYGWLVEHQPLRSAENKIHGRKNIIKATFLRKNGVHPELPHYRQTTSHNLDFPFI